MAGEGEGFEIPVTLSLKDIRKQLKEIKSDLANATDPEQMARLSEKAGELQDNLARVNEQAAVFSSGSKFEQSANALGLMNSQLMSLDFEGAAESALLLQDRIMSITPEEVTKQMKGLQDTFSALGKVSGTMITGLIKNVGAMAKAFMAFGAQLLANPIFIFAIVVAAIVAVIALLLQKLGLLKPVMDAIGAVFEWIGDVIDAVVQSIKDFLDWLGLTDYAAEDSARKQTEAAEKKADAYEKASKKITQSLDHEIKMAQINGKATVGLEIEKQKVIRKTAQLRLEALQAKYRENKLTEEMDAEELKALHEKIDAQKELIRTSNYEMQEIRARDAADQKKKADEDAKEAKAEADKNAKENREKAKQYRADRLAAERQYRDVELQLMKEGAEKELAIDAEKYKRLLEDTKNNEKLTGAEKKALIELYTKQAADSQLAIRTANNEEIKRKELEQAKTLAEIAVSQDEESFEKKRDLIDAQEEIELSAKELTEAEKAAIEERYRKAREEINNQEKAAKEAEFAAELEKVAHLAELAKLKNENDLEAAKAFLDAQMEIELNNKELTEEQRAVIEERYRQERLKLDEEAAAKRKELEAQVTKAAEQGLEGLMALNDLVYSVKSKKLKDGSVEEQKAAKKNFEINKKIQIAQAIIQGIQATLAAYSSGAAIPVVGAVTGPIFAALAAAAALGNINKIKSAQFDGGGGGGSSSSGGGGSAAAAAAASAPVFNLSGNGANANNASGSKPVEQVMNVTVEANISEAQVTGVQKKVVKYENSATLTTNG